MGANAVTTVPVYTAGEVLTAADMNITNSGIPVFATTVTRDAAFGGTGEKTLAEGQFAYIEATNTTQYYDGAAWQSVGVTPGLVLITSATVTAAATVSVNSCFTSTYTNYLINFVPTADVGGGGITWRLRASATDATTNYRSQRIFGISSNIGASQLASTTSFYLGTGSAYQSGWNIQVFNPQLAVTTSYQTFGQQSDGLMLSSGSNTNSTSYDGFSILTDGTSFSGTVFVYGYAKV